MSTKFRYIGRSAQSVIKYIISRMRKYPSFFEANSTIAANVGCSLRTVQNAIKRGEQLGIFQVESRFEDTLNGKKRQTTNVISLLAYTAFELVQGIFKVARVVKKAIKLVEVAKSKVSKNKPIRTELIPDWFDEEYKTPAPAKSISMDCIMDKIKAFRKE